MRLINSIALTLLPAVAVMALPSAEQGVTKRQSATVVTDQLMFSITLPAFESRRNARDPPTLDWSSDGCTASPDNPFGFPFVPACHRHDFGYQNFRAQSRFTEANKLRIDNNFRTDLYYQCSSVILDGVCRALADVYYAAVRAFGGSSAGKRDDDLVKEYEEKVAIYNALVAEAQAEGKLPII